MTLVLRSAVLLLRYYRVYMSLPVYLYSTFTWNNSSIANTFTQPGNHTSPVQTHQPDGRTACRGLRGHGCRALPRGMSAVCELGSYLQGSGCSGVPLPKCNIHGASAKLSDIHLGLLTGLLQQPATESAER